MKIKRLTYLLGAVLVVALSVFPSTLTLADGKVSETFPIYWYEELGQCNDGSTIVDSEVLNYDRIYYPYHNGELKIIDHIRGNAMIYVKENPNLFVKADPFGSNSVWHFAADGSLLSCVDSGSVYKLTIPGHGNIYSAVGRSIWEFTDSGPVMTFSRGNWTPRQEIVNNLCTYFGLQ